jgi:hypothetical protein
VWSNDLEGYAGDSISTGRASHAGHVEDDDHTRINLLRDYANENTCLIFGPDNPATFPYNPSTFLISGHPDNKKTLLSQYITRRALPEFGSLTCT